ncbi:hypothetical protein MRBLBA3_000917, partial [Bacillus sp. LBA3-1-1.1]
TKANTIIKANITTKANTIIKVNTTKANTIIKVNTITKGSNINKANITTKGSNIIKYSNINKGNNKFGTVEELELQREQLELRLEQRGMLDTWDTNELHKKFSCAQGDFLF